jgi:aspartate racemase
VEVVVPEQVETIYSAYMNIVNGGTEDRTRIAQELPVDAVLLAGTDLAQVFDETNTEFSHIDCAKVHIQAILREL